MATSLTSPAAVFTTDKAIIAARKALAKVSLFTTNFTAEAVQPGSTMKVPVFTSGSAEAYDAASNNYEHVEGSVSYAPVTFAHVKNTFQFDDTDFLLANGGSFFANAAKASGNAIAVAIEGSVGGLFKTDDVAKKVVWASATAVTKANIAKLRKTCSEVGSDPARSVLLLDPDYFAAALALLDANIYGGAAAIQNGVIEGLYGFKAVMECSQLPSGVFGAIVPEDAVVVAGRVVPVMSPAVYEEVGVTTDEESGLSVGMRRHGNR